MYHFCKAPIFIFLILQLLSPTIWKNESKNNFSSSNSQQFDWSYPAEIFNGKGDYVTYPNILSDHNNNVHVFWEVVEGSIGTGLGLIYYSRWDGESWSAPNDIIISPGGRSARQVSVAIDQNDVIHAVWVGDYFYYSQVQAQDAGNPHAWAPVQKLAANSSFSSIVVDAGGNLHVVYSVPGNDVYYIHSDDGGQTWSSPTNISKVSRNTGTDLPRIAIDTQGVMHVVWTEYPLPEAYPPLGVFYQKSMDGGKTWSSSTQLAGSGQGQANIAIDGSGYIHVAWNGDAATKGRYHIWSSDAGDTWSKAENFTGGSEGLTGPPSMVVDSTGIIHLVVADTLGDSGSGNYYTQLVNTQLSKPEIVVAAPGDNPFKGKWYGESPALGITHGNQLILVVPAYFMRLWYSTRFIDAPYQAPQPVSTITPQASSMLPPVVTSEPISSLPTLGSNPVYTNQTSSQPVYQAFSPAIPLVISSVLVMVVIGATVLYRLTLGKRD